jgi:hypothetical protein
MNGKGIEWKTHSYFINPCRLVWSRRKAYNLHVTSLFVVVIVLVSCSMIKLDA